MAAELKQNFVAFLDVLGFSMMVKADVEASSDSYLVKLFRCHQSAASIFRDEPNCSIVQFSDSIVVSMPYEADKFQWFVKKLAEYQRLLLDESLLCRGGVAVNKHFSNGTFTFSAGLIDAYRVESTSARYPRIVISPDVLDLVYPEIKDVPRCLLMEDDGLYFVDYIGSTKSKKPRTLLRNVEGIIADLTTSKEPSVREKGIWLSAYCDAILGTETLPKKFTGLSVLEN